MIPPSISRCLNRIAQTIFDRKGFNILILDVRGVSTMTDYLVLAEGSVPRHAKALADYLVDELRPFYGSPQHVEGVQFADWIVLDYGEIVIHLFIPELREYYGLEKLWQQGKIVDVAIDLSATPIEEP